MMYVREDGVSHLCWPMLTISTRRIWGFRIGMIKLLRPGGPDFQAFEIRLGWFVLDIPLKRIEANP